MRDIRITPPHPVERIAWSHDGALLISLSALSVCIWQVRDRALIQTITTMSSIEDAVLLPGNDRLVIITQEKGGTLSVIDLASGAILARREESNVVSLIPLGDKPILSESRI